MLTDYNTLRMQLFHNGKLVELQGDDDVSLPMISFPQLRHLCHRQGDGYCFHIAVTPASSNPLHDSTLPPNIRSLLAKYAPLF